MRFPMVSFLPVPSGSYTDGGMGLPEGYRAIWTALHERWRTSTADLEVVRRGCPQVVRDHLGCPGQPPDNLWNPDYLSVGSCPTRISAWGGIQASASGRGGYLVVLYFSASASFYRLLPCAAVLSP